MAEALKLLPAEFRMPVVLRDLEEWSYEEISASLELPVGTVKSRISRGRGQRGPRSGIGRTLYLTFHEDMTTT